MNTYTSTAFTHKSAGLCAGVGLFTCALELHHQEIISKIISIYLIPCTVSLLAALSLSVLPRSCTVRL